jgi:hypothetical protein
VITRCIVGAGVIAGVALALPAALTSQPDERARPSAHEDSPSTFESECTAARERALLATQARAVRALAAKRIAVTDLDPLTLDTLRKVAKAAGACAGDPHPDDASVYVTTRHEANLTMDAMIPSDRPSFYLKLHGSFDHPHFKGPSTGTFIGLVLDAETLFTTDYSFGLGEEDTSALGAAVPLIP